MSPEVRVEITTPIATVHIDPAGGRDTLTTAGWRELTSALEALSVRDDVACVVVSGAGGPPVGRSAAGDADPDVPRASEAIGLALQAIRRCPHPTVAVIEGTCAGGALEIAACCDLRVCGESSRFGPPIDAPPALPVGEPEPLAQLLGASQMLDLLRSGEPVGAVRALTYGLVNRVHPDDKVEEQGYGLAARIAAGAPLVNRWHKDLVRRLYEPRAGS